jgi:hypothetical protein
MRRILLAVLSGSILVAGSSLAAPRWCLGFGGLGPIRAGLTADQVLSLADWPGIARTTHSDPCWVMPYDGGKSDFSLLIIDGKVARLEIRGASTLTTFSGARVGMSEAELKALYGTLLDSQPHKYDETGRVFTLRSSSGEFGLRFETSAGKVTIMHAGPWEHLHYVEGCG